jgi:hypothetical protein
MGSGLTSAIVAVKRKSSHLVAGFRDVWTGTSPQRPFNAVLLEVLVRLWRARKIGSVILESVLL